MPKSVHEIPSYEEYFGIQDNILDESDFEVDSSDDEELKKIMIIMLGLFEEFYYLHMYDEAVYYNSEQFLDDITELNNELKSNLITLFATYISNLKINLDAEWRIPSEIMEIQLEVEQLINSGIDSVTRVLYYDLVDKSDFYTTLSMTSGSFSPHSNYRRAVKKLTNQIKFKGTTLNKIVNRRYMEFIYGQEALFYWKCSGVNTCAWCYEIEAKGAMPLSWFPIDHINGRCVLVPLYPEVYSDEYLNVRY